MDRETELEKIRSDANDRDRNHRLDVGSPFLFFNCLDTGGIWPYPVVREDRQG